MRTFEFDGKKYREASTHQKEWGSKIIMELNLSGSESVLDLGCGDGILTNELAKRVPAGRVVGIDASIGMIKTAQDTAFSNTTFMVMDINEINFINEFDVIFSNAALHWIKDHQKLLNNCIKALKDAGVIRWNFAGDGNCSNFYSVVREVMTDIKYQSYFKTFEWPWYMPDIKEYEHIVKAAGFREVEVWPENADRYFPSSEEMIKWIDQPSIVPFLSYISEEDRVGFRDQVVQRMLERTKQQDGTCFETFRRINVFAKK